MSSSTLTTDHLGVTFLSKMSPTAIKTPLQLLHILDPSISSRVKEQFTLKQGVVGRLWVQGTCETAFRGVSIHGVRSGIKVLGS